MRRRRHPRAPAALAPLLLAAGALGAPGQEPAAREGAAAEAEPESELDRVLRAARAGKSPQRPEAAARLVDLGEPAVERLLAEAGPDGALLGALGADVVGVLGRFGDARLRALAWRAVRDVDFPWRPAAARTLAGTATDPAELSSFVALVDDPLSAVRAEAVAAVGRLHVPGANDVPEEAPADTVLGGVEEPENVPAGDALQLLVRARLADPTGIVRRRAAAVLDAWGERGALAWLLEELRRDDRYFTHGTGPAARADAARLLKASLGDLAGYRAELAPTDPANVEALEALETRVRELVGGVLPQLPDVARAGAPAGDAPTPLGLEVHSCRGGGEHWLAWGTDDVLRVGTGHPALVPLPDGTVATLIESAGPLLDALGKNGAWGTQACDFEQLYWWPNPTLRVRPYLVSHGPNSSAPPRPPELDQLLDLLLETLPENGDDPRLQNLREDVRRALSK